MEEPAAAQSTAIVPFGDGSDVNACEPGAFVPEECGMF